MKFKAGDTIDVQHCKALQHEFLRCHDAFIEFTAIATRTITAGEDRFTAYRMYNAYARFLHHLYEFMAGSLARDIHDTRIAKTNEEARNAIEKYIMGHAARLLGNKRQAIDNVRAPGWEQALAALPTAVPLEFAKNFREHRNVVSGHVNYARASNKLLGEYKAFLKTLNGILLRRRSSLLGKEVNLFTTNIDVFNEKAIEDIGLEFNDGFNGRFKLKNSFERPHSVEFGIPIPSPRSCKSFYGHSGAIRFSRLIVRGRFSTNS